MLINITDITSRRELSENIPTKKLNPHILSAERMDLKPLLGERFYRDISANPSLTTRGNYPLLLDGGTYTYSDIDYEQPGIKDILVDFAYARIMFFGPVTSTPFGMRIRQGDNSSQPSTELLREHYTALREEAKAKWQEVKDYMNRDGNFTYWYGPKSELNVGQDYPKIIKATLS